MSLQISEKWKEKKLSTLNVSLKKRFDKFDKPFLTDFNSDKLGSPGV